MLIVLTAAVAVLIIWSGVLTYFAHWHSREIKVLLLGLKHIAGAEKHVGGTGRGEQRGQPVFVGHDLVDDGAWLDDPGFLRVQDHARPCRIVDLSRSGAQLLPEGGNFPLGQVGVLTVEFGEFDSGTTHVRIVRIIQDAHSLGVQFVDTPRPFQEKCAATIRRVFREQATPV